MFYFLVSKGVSNNMLKAGSKRRRTTAQIKAEKEAKETQEQEVAAKLAMFDSLKAENQQLHAQSQNNQGAADILGDLMQKGLVQQEADGSFRVDSPVKNDAANYA